MDELMDMIASDESPSQISDRIKEILFSKASDKIDDLRPSVADSIFNNSGTDQINFNSEEE